MSEPGSQPWSPLVPAPVRRPAAVLAAAAVLVVVVLGIRYHDDAVAGRLDAGVSRAVPETLRLHWGALNAVADLVPPLAIAGAVVLAVALGVLRRWRLAVLVLAAPVLTTVVTETVKHLVDRTLGGHLALPSGHTAGATSVLVVVALAVLGRARRHVPAVAGVLLLAVTAGAGAVGLTMVSIEAHYPTDTVAGFATALAVTLGLALGMDAAAGRARARTRGPGAELGLNPAPAGRAPR